MPTAIVDRELIYIPGEIFACVEDERLFVIADATLDLHKPELEPVRDVIQQGYMQLSSEVIQQSENFVSGIERVLWFAPRMDS